MEKKSVHIFLKITALILGVLIAFSSCKRALELKEETSPDSEKGPDTSKIASSELFAPPSYFPPPVYDFSANPLTKEKVELGRMLFYDPILSGDSTIACSNCHQPMAAFSHMAHSVSHGIGRKTGVRNAPALFNLAWMSNFMLDGGIIHLDVQSIAPISNPLEMGSSLPEALKALNKNAVYRKKFKEAWNVEEIGSEQMLKSLSQFMLTIVSGKSKYDMYRQGKEPLSEDELEGLHIVRTKCAPCHGGELFTDFSIRNIGLDSTAGDTSDLGKEMTTRLKSDRRKFRSPSLRNFTLTSPYMHNGITYGLYGALDRHDSLIHDAPNLDPLMRQNGKLGIPLTSQERSKVYAFILTLTDNTISSNPAFTTPFDRYAPDH